MFFDPTPTRYEEVCFGSTFRILTNVAPIYMNSEESREIHDLILDPILNQLGDELKSVTRSTTLNSDQLKQVLQNASDIDANGRSILLNAHEELVSIVQKVSRNKSSIQWLSRLADEIEDYFAEVGMFVRPSDLTPSSSNALPPPSKL